VSVIVVYELDSTNNYCEMMFQKMEHAVLE